MPINLLTIIHNTMEINTFLNKSKYTVNDLQLKLKQLDIPFKTRDTKSVLEEKIMGYLRSQKIISDDVTNLQQSVDKLTITNDKILKPVVVVLDDINDLQQSVNKLTISNDKSTKSIISDFLGRPKYTVNDIQFKLRELSINYKTRETKRQLEEKLLAHINGQPIDVIKEQKSEKVNKKKKRIPLAMRVAVWDKYFPKQRYGECFVCSREISMEMFECGHVDAESKGGETELANLIPVCSLCNKSMATKNLHDFANDYKKITNNNNNNT